LYEITQDPRIIEIRKFEDVRGILLSADLNHCAFEIKRVFIITSANDQLSRGNHAHKICQQLILAVGGSLFLTVRNTSGSHELEVREGFGLIVPPWNWCSVRFESTQTCAVVLCSDFYDPEDYVEGMPSD
jgi:dTDP-4-dehydrorhamnose 3,5-epimerase-like enzyme